MSTAASDPPPADRRLPNTAPWRLRTALAVVVAAMVVLGVASSGLPGRWIAVCIPLLLLAAYLLPTLLRTRHGLAVVGDRLYVRRWGAWRSLAPREVTEVRQVFNPGSPNFRLVTPDDARGLFVPTADLDRGHSTLFTWLLTHARSARLDAAAERTADLLRQRGLLDDVPGDQRPEEPR